MLIEVRSGYELVDTKRVILHAEWPDSNPVTVRVSEGAAVRRKYDPLADHPDLYIRFLELDLSDRDRLVSFACEFGLLGLPECRDGEPVPSWRDHQVQMRGAILFWEGMRSGNARDLARVLPANVEKRLQAVQGREAKRRVALEANAADLEERVSRFLAQYVGASIVPRRQGRRVTFDLEYEPRSLVGALWLQCAMAITGQREFRRCKNCGKRFEVSRGSQRTKTRRSDARFCAGATCRAKYHQRCRFRVGRLRKEGWSLGDIAVRLDEPTSQVRRWLRSQRGPR